MIRVMVFATVVGFCLFTSSMVGIFTQPWAGWWFPGAQANPPGVVPLVAVQAPQGPLMADTTPLMRAITPWLGVPYLFGGCGLRGVDCSCFVQNVYRELGVALPRTAQTQWNATARVGIPEVGDLVFFERTYSSPDRITHVGVVVGSGVMVSAAEPSVGRQSYDAGFWKTKLAGFGRVR